MFKKLTGQEKGNIQKNNRSNRVNDKMTDLNPNDIKYKLRMKIQE